MKRIFITMLIVASFVFGLTGCDKTASIRKAKEEIAKARIYGRNVQKANNDGFRAGNLSAGDLAKLTAAAAKYRDGINIAEKAIAAADEAIKNGATAKDVLGVLQSELDSNVINALQAFVESVTTVPPALTDKVKNWLAAIQVVIATIRTLFADAQHAAGGENYGTA